MNPNKLTWQHIARVRYLCTDLMNVRAKAEENPESVFYVGFRFFLQFTTKIYNIISITSTSC